MQNTQESDVDVAVCKLQAATIPPRAVRVCVCVFVECDFLSSLSA